MSLEVAECGVNRLFIGVKRYYNGVNRLFLLPGSSPEYCVYFSGFVIGSHRFFGHRAMARFASSGRIQSTPLAFPSTREMSVFLHSPSSAPDSEVPLAVLAVLAVLSAAVTRLQFKSAVSR